MNGKRMLRILGGSAVGAVNGLFGGGGGMIAVPVLKGLGRSPRAAHATAIAVILPASAMSAAVYLLNGFLPPAVFVPVALGVLLGGYLGAKLLFRCSGRGVTLLFSALMFGAGVWMIL